jgi:transcriptional repressor NrdR
MRCPKCGLDNDRVVDSRSVNDGAGVRRRRECLNCNHRFSTFEGVIPEEIRVIKRTGEREDYSKEKLRLGIANACYKRPVSSETIDITVENITRYLLNNFDREVPSIEIGRLVMEELRNLDQVAYVRFASVYREFKDVDTFLAELKELKDKSEHI